MVLGQRHRHFARAAAVGIWLVSLAGQGRAQERVPSGPMVRPPSNEYRLSLDEAKGRALSNSRLRAIVSMNIAAKREGVYVAEADYYPKLFASFTGFHFNEPLGSVLTPSRLPAVSVAVHVFDQNLGLTTVTAVQPITALLKVRQGVRVAEADERIARSQAWQEEQAIASGVEQLYYGLLAANRILAGGEQAARAAATMGPPQTLEARTAAIEGAQAMQQVGSQAADLQEQLNSMMNLPLDTRLVLIELPPLVPQIGSADEAVGRALASSPEVFQADQDVNKATAALQVAKLDFLPNIAVLGGVADQDGIPSIQSDFSFMGITATQPLFEGGKLIHAQREAETVLSMARQKACQTRDETRLKAWKTYREFDEAGKALRIAEQMVAVRREAQQHARTPDDMLKTGGDLMKAEAALIQAEATFRVSYAKLLNVAGMQ